MTGFPPLISPPSHPLDLENVEAFTVPKSIGKMVGEGRARDAVTRNVLRPADLETAELEPVQLIWVPLWRFEATADSFHLRLDRMWIPESSSGPIIQGGSGRRPPRSPRRRRGQSVVTPGGGFRHRDRTVAVLGRAGFPIDPSAKISIALTDLVPALNAQLDAQSTVLPDVPQEDAQEGAVTTLRRAAEPSNALFSKVDVNVRDARLCFYPLYVQRYRYGGEAVEGGASIFFAAVSGQSGKVVATRHPSALRSVGSQLRRLFSRG